MSHTPTPWAIDPYSEAETIAIHSPEKDEHVCIIQGQGEEGHCTVRDEANAEFIVRACNGHDDLLAALIAITNFADEHVQVNDVDPLIKNARAAINKAQGKDA